MANDGSKDLLEAENVIYLRMPGYGSSYICGKDAIDEIVLGYLEKNKNNLKFNFSWATFWDEFNAQGMIPLSMIKKKMMA